VAAPYRNHGVRRLDDKDVSRVPHPGADHNGEERVPVAGIGHDADRLPAVIAGPPARGFHHAAHAAADERCMVLCKERPDAVRCSPLFRRGVPRPDDGDLHGISPSPRPG